MNLKNDVVLVIRTVISRDLYENAKASGYSRDDIKSAIRDAGISELQSLVDVDDGNYYDDEE